MTFARAALFILVLVAALSGAGAPARALSLAQQNALVATFEGRLNNGNVPFELRTDAIKAKLVGDFRAAFNRWYAADYPKDLDALRDAAFLANMQSRLSALRWNQINQIRDREAAGEIDDHLSDIFDAVAFYTIASSDQDPGDDVARRAWTRDPSGAYHTVPSAQPLNSADWDAIERRAHAHLDAVALNLGMLDDSYGVLGRVSPPLKPETNRQFLAQTHTRDVMTGNFVAEFRARYAREGTVVDDTLLQDLAEAKYVLTGWELGESGTPQLVGARRLEALEALLADNRPLLRHLREAELAAGFRANVVHPIGFVDPPDFAAILQGGYSLFDIGAGPYHGDESHNLQLFALMQDQAENPLRYSRPVIDIVRAIGALDRPARPLNRFGIEDAVSAWAVIFDLNNVNPLLPELSHPNSVLDVTRAHIVLPRLTAQLEGKSRRRADMRARLLGEALVEFRNNRPLTNRFPWVGQGDSTVNDVEAWVAAAAEPDATPFTHDTAGDLLYTELYYSRLQAKARTLGAIDLGNGTIPALVEGGTLPLDDTDPAFAARLGAARRQLADMRFDAQLPPAPAADSAADDLQQALSDRAAADSDSYGADSDIEDGSAGDFGVQQDRYSVSDTKITEDFEYSLAPVDDDASSDPLRESLEQQAQDDNDDASSLDRVTTVVFDEPVVLPFEDELDAFILANLDALSVPEHNPAGDIAADLAFAEADAVADRPGLEDAPASPPEDPSEDGPPERAERGGQDFDMRSAISEAE